MFRPLDFPCPFRLSSDMSPESPEPSAVPPSVARVLKYFRSLGREEKMAALVQYAKKLEPLPERFRHLDRANFTVPETQDGKLHFYADVDVRRSPTIAAVLSIVFSAVNGQPPSTTLAIPEDF